MIGQRDVIQHVQLGRSGDRGQSVTGDRRVVRNLVPARRCLAADAHLWLVRALAASFDRAPVGFLDWSAGGATSALTDMFTQLFTAGLTFAAPVMVLLAAVTLMMGILIRAVPQINVIEFGFNLRVAGGLIALLVFAPWIAPASEQLLDALMLHLSAGLDALEGSHGG